MNSHFLELFSSWRSSGTTQNNSASESWIFNINPPAKTLSHTGKRLYFFSVEEDGDSRTELTREVRAHGKMLLRKLSA